MLPTELGVAGGPLYGMRDLCFDFHLGKRNQPGFPEGALPAEIVAPLPVPKERLLYHLMCVIHLTQAIPYQPPTTARSG